MFNQETLKRVLDISVSIVVTLSFLPFFLPIVVINSFFVGPGVFFIQERVGKDQKLFNLLKLRTMTSRENQASPIAKEQRWSHGDKSITRFGAFLRKYSIDELPSIINVLKGDMSLVGPRPLLREHISSYSTDDFVRHNVKPGLTGLAQIKGRNKLSWSMRYRYDRFYVSHRSFCMDVYILLITLKVVIFKDGFDIGGDAVQMEK